MLDVWYWLLEVCIFKSAVLKLTLVYVAIVMIISVSFSIVLYNISTREIDRGLGRQTRALRDFPTNNPLFEQLENIRAEELNNSHSNLKTNLAYFNLLILLVSFGISYLLAKITLKPIEDMILAQSRFTADASHELKTPLTAMKTEIEVNLRDKNLNLSDAKVLLKSNLEEIEKLEYLSSALVKLAQYEEDSKKIKSQVESAKIVESATKKVQKTADLKNIEIEGKVKNISIMGDESSLVELLVILLDNAIKYSPKKSVINIDVLKKDNKALIRISDHGIGIKASDLPHIFDRFYRADLSRTKESIDGFGLGLSIAKRIVKLHNGEISATSEPNKGSTFEIKLPL